MEWSIDVGICAADLIQVIREAAAGTLVDSSVAEGRNTECHLGAGAGLSPRESLILQIVVQSLSNQQIADTLYLSINSIKTYIRSAYRKIDSTTRAQAAAWGIQHGFPVETPPTDQGPVGVRRPVKGYRAADANTRDLC